LRDEFITVAFGNIHSVANLERAILDNGAVSANRPKKRERDIGLAVEKIIGCLQPDFECVIFEQFMLSGQIGYA